MALICESRLVVECEIFGLKKKKKKALVFAIIISATTC
jgi:hypothetical protein